VISIFDETREELLENTDEKYRDFNKSLVPGETAPMIGVRLPKLREIAKRLAKLNPNSYEATNNGENSYIHYLEAVKTAKYRKSVYQEELLLWGMLIGYIKCDNDEHAKMLDEFIPVIDNWAVCDSSCMTYKFMKKDLNYWYSYLLKYISSEKEYDIRFAVVCMLDYFITDEYIDRVLEHLGNIDNEAYYVKMAVAWAVSVCYIHYPEKTWNLLASDKLDDDTHKKALQKIRDSYRVSKEEKERLNELKR